MEADRSFPFLRTVLTTALAAVAATAAGCGYAARPAAYPTTAPDGASGKPALRIGGYTAGSLHPANVSSVYVQMFASQEFRRELEFRLTEALAKRIATDTPYKIAKKNRADTLLYGEITVVAVTLVGSDFEADLPRESQIVLVCNWTWKDQRTGEVLAQRRGMEQAANYFPLARETFFDGSEKGINDLAERIVEAMEADW